ncbi:SDR family oxidoreductase [Luteimonas deserti]|uniref:SDR family NAD(P)-dependent oxidoreductase n=1 Tax=Luteimonas deserti TaxID=2752306 RepID=A0A7Z0QRV2_9GAMM|nr:SDR family oxidoreductase [Luteimonas deserti]NYZ61870.1 SDR family NAD(P)-dependent oxidoreductase [Luteimonas deserti]
MKHKPLDEQVIVITGASSGIGLCTALLAAERGARVVLLARSGEALEDVVAAIGAEGGKAEAFRVDVADRDQIDDAVERILAAHGRIDTWVNNAGVSIYGRLDEVAEDDHRRLFEVNFWGVVNGSLAALPSLRSSEGVLVNLGSEVSEGVIPLQGMYAASKHAVKGFTDALRVEEERVDGQPVTIVLIQPTAVNTPFPQHARNYLEHEPKLPEPTIDPHRVAEAILDAAEKGGRDVKVGAFAHVNTALSKILPRLADRMSAARAGQQEHDAPPLRPEGTLFKPGQSGQVYGVDDDGEVIPSA